MAHLYMPPAKPPPSWRSSPAKKLLRKGILSGEFPEGMDAEAVYGCSTEFRQYPWTNFKTNLTNLRAALKREIERAEKDAANFAVDIQLRPAVAVAAQGYPTWAGSEAARLLKDDVDDGEHLVMTPKALHESRPVYQAWPLTVFRNHIQQEIRSRKTQAYWLHRDPNGSAAEPWPTIDSL